jgi:hypothetical protein
MIDRCLLWAGAKTLAKDRGFEMGQWCPVEQTCIGTRRIYLAKDKLQPIQIDKFYAKLEAHETKRRLAALRQELHGTRLP